MNHPLLTVASKLTETMRTKQTDIAELGKQRRAALYQMWEDGVSQPELAKALGVSIQTIWSEIQKAKP